MAVYAINYDLNDPGQDYSELHDAIKDLGSYCHILESCWVVQSSKSASDIRDLLQDTVDNNDEILVFKNGSNWATSFTDNCTEWLHDH